MRELERELRQLPVAWPPTPDIAAAVAARLESPRPRRRRWRRWWLGVIAAVAAVGVVEPARTAVLDVLGLRGVMIERRTTPPPVRSAGRELNLGEPTSLENAKARGFRPPRALAGPTGVFAYLDHEAVSFVYGRKPPFEALVTIYRGYAPFIQKSAGPGVRIDRVRVDGHPGFFLSGAHHGFGYANRRGTVGFESQRLAGATLLVERPDALVRVETEAGRDRAVAIARSVPPSR